MGADEGGRWTVVAVGRSTTVVAVVAVDVSSNGRGAAIPQTPPNRFMAAAAAAAAVGGAAAKAVVVVVVAVEEAAAAKASCRPTMCGVFCRCEQTNESVFVVCVYYTCGHGCDRLCKGQSHTYHGILDCSKTIVSFLPRPPFPRLVHQPVFLSPTPLLRSCRGIGPKSKSWTLSN